MRKKLISLDFDGVLNSYTSGWQGADQCPDAPVPGAMQFLQSLVADDRFDAVIYSFRCASEEGVAAIRNWLDRHLVSELGEHAGRYVGNRLRVASSKPPAFVHIDDRAITFDGTWPGLDAVAASYPGTISLRKPRSRSLCVSSKTSCGWRSWAGIIPCRTAYLSKRRRKIWWLDWQSGNPAEIAKLLRLIDAHLDKHPPYSSRDEAIEHLIADFGQTPPLLDAGVEIEVDDEAEDEDGSED